MLLTNLAVFWGMSPGCPWAVPCRHALELEILWSLEGFSTDFEAKIAWNTNQNLSKKSISKMMRCRSAAIVGHRTSFRFPTSQVNIRDAPGWLSAQGIEALRRARHRAKNLFLGAQIRFVGVPRRYQTPSDFPRSSQKAPRSSPRKRKMKK